MNKRNAPEIPGRFVLFILSMVAVILLFVSYTTDFKGGYIRAVSEAVFIPMQSGISAVTERLLRTAEENTTIEKLSNENELLKSEVERLEAEISGITLRKSELEKLRSLLELKDTYNNYETTGATIIGSSVNNWFNTFIIDKGSNDGIEVNMNVLAGEGLVGIVTSVGKTHATVRAIIDDNSSISAMVSSTEDYLIVNGSLKEMTETGMIELSNLEDLNNRVKVGDTIVTSNISDKYVPGILIGYITKLEDDANGLTKYGTVAPVADFKHLNEVLVVLTTKETGDR